MAEFSNITPKQSIFWPNFNQFLKNEVRSESAIKFQQIQMLPSSIFSKFISKNMILLLFYQSKSCGFEKLPPLV